MENHFKIQIPKPCFENWNHMKPSESGKFCDSCSKNVVDFTAMKTTEIQEYFIQNKGKTCGRFYSAQLDLTIITIPQQLIFKQMPFRKSFLLVLFITMGTTLFSCTDSSGERKTIDKIEVSAEENSESHRTLGIIITPIDSIKADESTAEKNRIKSLKAPTTKGEITHLDTISE